jgi:tRNA threonylcarbamoyladenosine biosynthesis protein TsaB
MSIILAIETTTELASCALLRGEQALFRQSSGVQTHSHAILPMVQSLLAEAGLSLRQCDAIAFGAGPGSFTGVRTACGVAQGLAFGAGLPVVPVVTLAAMAHAARVGHGAAEVLAVLDARMGEVYWAQYRFEDGAEDGGQIVVPPTLSRPEAVRPQAPGAKMLCCGNGLTAYAGAFGDLRAAYAWIPELMPHALQIGALGQQAFAAGLTLDAEAAQPIYLRNKIAFTSAERAEKNAALQEAAP